MRLFLTGATGFVGFNLLLEALRSGRYDEIVVPVRDPRKLERQLAAEGVTGRVESVRVIGWNETPPGDVDHAVHCAGVLFARSAAEYVAVNVDDTMRLLSALSPVARLVVLSSQSAGGPTPAGKAQRTAADPDSPLTWYGQSKLLMEKKVAEAFPNAQIWRPPMILGARDRATLPLFQMAARPVRFKPGVRTKSYSWIAVSDLVAAIFRALESGVASARPLPVGAADPITDLDLFSTAAEVMGIRGRTVPVPHPVLRLVGAVVDGVPRLRAAIPSLTRDRIREIFPDRWIVDGAEFRRQFAPGPMTSLRDALGEAYAWYVRSGALRAA